jgi:hypothetical protein
MKNLEILYFKVIKMQLKMKDNTFFVVMTGDSRDKKVLIMVVEAEHELFFKEQGLHIYNKIIFLESEFTRFSQAKKHFT